MESPSVAAFYPIFVESFVAIGHLSVNHLPVIVKGTTEDTTSKRLINDSNGLVLLIDVGCLFFFRRIINLTDGPWQS